MASDGIRREGEDGEGITKGAAGRLGGGRKYPPRAARDSGAGRLAGTGTIGPPAAPRPIRGQGGAAPAGPREAVTMKTETTKKIRSAAEPAPPPSRRAPGWLSAAAAALFTLTGFAPAAAAQTEENRRVPGLRASVEVLADRWGIDHIYAENEDDLFFAQGYRAAESRLFQFEIWRRQATGTVAEILGPAELDRDIGARLHRFRKDLGDEMRYYHPRGDRIIPAFVRGINAAIERALRDPDSLPLEFQLLGIRPEPWTEAAVISRHQGLLSNVTRELEYGMAVAAVGPEALRDVEWFRPGVPMLDLDPAIDGSLLKPEILDTYRAFRGPVNFLPEQVVIAERRNPDAGRQALLRQIPSELRLTDLGEHIGSNNWVVGGERTWTGLPLIVNDPHRTIVAPSLRYFVHLHAPGWNVIGGGEPVLPGLSIGHNEKGGWGLTVFGQDNEDLMVYDTNPANPNEYRYLGEWEAMTVRTERIPVEGQADHEATLKYTRHGPVVYEDTENRKAYALNAAWLEIGNSPYLASLRMDQAETWEEFVEACNYSGIPAENMIWGDVEGNIGYQAVGVSPIRNARWSGLVPVPGDGRYEWSGYLPIKALPSVLNPPKGFWGTANNLMAPAVASDYPHPEALHFTWGDEMRGLRVDELMRTGRRLTVQDMMAFQHDELSVVARNLVPLLLLAEPPESAEKAMLADWDFVMAKESTAATLYLHFERQVSAAMRELFVPEAARGLLRGVNKKRMLDHLMAPDGRFGEDPIAGRDRLLLDAFAAAIGEVEERFGADREGWRYGQEAMKHVHITHYLANAVDEETRALLEVGPWPRGGYESTVNNTSGSDNQRSGGSFRVILDPSNWDNSVATSAPGQSGDPESPHYRDLFELWVRHQYFPLAYTRAKVESVTEHRLLLEPAN